MSSITSANAVIAFVVPGLYPVPQQLQGFATDDVFDTDPVDNAEVMMGVDGKLSAGFVNAAIKQAYALQADSPSNSIFEAIYAAEQAAGEKFVIQGVVSLTSVNRTYAMNNGYLTTYPPIAGAKKVLQPRRYGITWESITTAPI